jgi:hypothetical protein
MCLVTNDLIRDAASKHIYQDVYLQDKLKLAASAEKCQFVEVYVARFNSAVCYDQETPSCSYRSYYDEYNSQDPSIECEHIGQ